MPSNGTTVPRTCEKCGRLFDAKVSEIKRGFARFCGHPCASSRPLLPPSIPEVQPDGTALLPLYGQDRTVKAYAIIDAADIELVGLHRWSVNKGYAVRSATGPRGRREGIKLHRVILGLTYGDGVDGDHRNRNRLDCRRSNLRSGTKGQNGQNKPAQKGRASSIYRGVRFRPKAKVKQWQATITVNGKRSSLGYFENEHEAGAVAKAARLRLMPYAVD